MEALKLFVRFVADTSEAIQGINKTAEEGEKTESRLKKAFSKMGSFALKAGKTIAKGIGAGAVAMGKLTLSALNAAGELEQNMGGSEAVFKKYAKSMQDTAAEAYKNMGLSQSDFLATANKMGALFQGSGFSIAESADMSAKAMQRAADVASIMGIDLDSAMESIAGAAKGNFTMMDNLGVAINDTTLQIYAQEKGLGKLETTQDKVGAAMQMFLEKTTYAAGNYAKENETLSGSLNTAKAAFNNFLSGAGDANALIESFTNAGNVIIRNLTDIFPRLVTGVTEIVNGLVPQIPGMLQAILPGLIEGAIALVNGLVAALPGIIDALSDVIPLLLNGIITITQALVDALPAIVDAIIDFIIDNGDLLLSAFVQLLMAIIQAIPIIIDALIDHLPMIVETIVNVLIENIPVLLAGAVQLFMAIVRAIPQIIGALKSSVASLVKAIMKPFEPLLNFFSEIWEGIKTVISTAIQIIINILDAAFQLITLPFRMIWENCKDTVLEIWNKIKTAISDKITEIKTKVSEVFTAIKTKITSVVDGIRTKVTSVFETIKSKITTPLNSAKTTVSNIFDGIQTKVTNVINSIKNTVEKGLNFVKGLFSKLKLNFPNIKLPHFGVTPKGWKIGDLLKGTVPKLSIDWYAKAMNSGMIMNSPTIFGVNGNGQLMGGGEVGSETVVGTGSLMSMIREAVNNETSELSAQFDNLISIMLQYFPQFVSGMNKNVVLDSGVLVGQLTPAIDSKMGNIYNRKRRGG